MKMKHIAIVIIIAIITSACTFTKTLYYNKANITDYKIFKNREVKTSGCQEWKLSEDYNKHSIPAKYIEDIKKIKTVSYLVVYNGEILHEEYWDKYDKDKYSNSFSMAKSFVSLLIGFAIDDGYIKSVDQKVSDFLDYFKEGKKNDITIRNLLTMSSGLNWNESYGNPFGNTAKSYYGRDIEKIIKSLPADFEPGKKFVYSSGDTQVLAFILEKATGKTLSDYMSEKLWMPLGAKNNALWSLDKKNGHEKAFCCFNSNARDFARIGQFVLQNGKWNGKQLLSDKYLKESLSPATYLKTSSGKAVDFYGFQWWMFKYKNMDIKFARGLLGQYIFIIPAKNLVIVRLGHHRSKTFVNGIPSDIYMWVDIALGMIKN